jgi:hypothetical protein
VRLFRNGILLLLALLPLLAPPAHAQQLRAWLDRDRIALGETATLNIEVDGAFDQAPDYSPLLGDFRISGNTSSRSFESGSAGTHARTLFAIALQPRREGVLGIPGLRVGSQRTQPLSLTVTAATAIPARTGDTVFIESEADAQSLYVQQAVGYVVRLYYSVPLVSGQLDQPAPDGASLQRVGEDVRYSRELGGKRYTVVERHFLLVPDHSGPLAIPAARFRGRGVGGVFDDFFGDGQRALQADGPVRVLDVRAIPANAPQPWLPLRSLSLRWASAPPQPRAGAASTVVVEAVADGATAGQVPELELPAIAGAQVFADQAQVDESFEQGRPRVTVRRSFSVVPDRPGSLRIQGPRLSWWDARAGVARTAELPPLAMQVAPGTGTSAAPSPPAMPVDDGARASAGGWMRVPGVQGRVRPWAFATVAFALLWLITFMWGLHRDPRAPEAAAPDRGGKRPVATAKTGLRKALAGGDLSEVAEALCAAMQPPAPDLDVLRQALDDPRQRDAVEALQHARWGDGDVGAARTLLREAFIGGPRWRKPDADPRPPLPPLYPP